MRIVKKILVISLVALLVGALGCAIYYLISTASASLDASALRPVQNCVSVYDENDHLIAECSASGANGTAYEDLSADTVHAFVSAEDKHFFSHGGLDYKRMAKALWRNVTSLSFKEGASTISQQLVKNTQLSPEKTIDRKLKEIKLTRQLERRYSKEEILEMYLNTIYFGHNCYGIESAARFYFDCQPEDLTLAQSATLAGMVRSPNNYSPFKQPEKCRSRRNYVLKVMESEGYISESQRLQAEGEELPEKENNRQGFAESYLDAVFSDAEEYIGENAYGGLKIYTYLDTDLQKKLESLSAMSTTDKSFCVIGNAERGVKAFYSTVGNASRLPASAIKPLLVYAPALEENIISPASPVLDESTDFGGYSPRNFDGEYHGYVSAREALAKSYNIPAVKILNALGTEKGAKYLEKMGLSLDRDDLSLALALGGMKNGYPLLDLTAAYTTFPCGGIYASPSFIRKITDKDGKTVRQRTNDERRVFGEDTTTLINDMLADAVTEGTARKLKSAADGFELCAKTGTGGTEAGNTDAYCISYTSISTVGVWLGNADNSPMEKISGGGLPANINGEIVKHLNAESTPPDLKKSADVVDCVLDKNEYEKNHKLVLCDPNAPVQEKTLHDFFKKSALPREQSDYFSRPSLPSPSVFVENNSICIVLCQAEYYTIIINRESVDGFQTVYQGKCPDKFTDTDVEPGKSYVYSVTPYYNQFVGKTIILPRVCLTRDSSTSSAARSFVVATPSSPRIAGKRASAPILCQAEYASKSFVLPCFCPSTASKSRKIETIHDNFYKTKDCATENEKQNETGKNMRVKTHFPFQLKQYLFLFQDKILSEKGSSHRQTLFMQKAKDSDEKEKDGYIPREWWRNRRRENYECLSVSKKHDRQENSDDRSDCSAIIFRTSLRSNPMHGYSDQYFLKNFSVPSVKNAVCAPCAIDDRYKNCCAIDWMKIIFPFVRRPFPLPLT